MNDIDLTRFIPYLLHRTDFLTLRNFEHNLKEQNVTLFEWRILACLVYYKQIRFGELAKSTAIEPPTMARVLADMEKRDLVRRVSSEEDKRARVVMPTDQGEQLAREIIPKALAHEEALLKGFTEDEVHLLQRFLDRLYKNMIHME